MILPPFPPAPDRAPCPPRGIAVRVILLFAWLLVLLPGAARAQLLDQAEARREGDAGWQRISLPDRWQDRLPDHGGAVWYRLQVNLDTPAPLLGIYLKRACNNAWIYANGQLLYSGGGPWEGARVRRNCHAPVLAAWPRDAQRRGRNEILVRIYSEAADSISSQQRKGHLSAVVVDRWQYLQPVHAHEYHVRLTIPRVASGLMLFTAITLFLIWWRIRREPIYLSFGLTMFAGALATARVFVHAPGIDNLTVERIVPGLAVIVCLAIVDCLVHLYDLRTGLRRLWWRLGAAIMVLLAATPAAWLQNVALVGYLVGATAVSVTLLQLYRQMLRNPFGEHKMFYLATAIVMGTAIHDLLIQFRVITYSDRPLIQTMLPILLLGFMTRLLARHAEALTIAETSRAELSERVQLITREIESSYERSVELEKDRAAQAERERIARDLHDDLGARLLTLVHRSPDDKTSESAREALSDLRLLIGQLHQPESTLTDAASDWRAETQERCDAAERRLDWSASVPPAQHLGTRQRIMLGRLLREAVTNIFKHTASPTVKVEFSVTDGELALAVSDTWPSAPVADWVPGIGMRSLEMRARQIGASLEWSDIGDGAGGKAGTRLCCRMPLEALDGRQQAHGVNEPP